MNSCFISSFALTDVELAEPMDCLCMSQNQVVAASIGIDRCVQVLRERGLFSVYAQTSLAYIHWCSHLTTKYSGFIERNPFVYSTVESSEDGFLSSALSAASTNLGLTA